MAAEQYVLVWGLEQLADHVQVRMLHVKRAADYVPGSDSEPLAAGSREACEAALRLLSLGPVATVAEADDDEWVDLVIVDPGD